MELHPGAAWLKYGVLVDLLHGIIGETKDRGGISTPASAEGRLLIDCLGRKHGREMGG